MLIALLAEEGFYGFEEEGAQLKAFAQATEMPEERLQQLLKDHAGKYSTLLIKEENWNAAWEAGFEPVTVSASTSKKPFAYIRASFHEADPACLYDIVVTPKMSFGTGHHATTYLMVSEMSALDLRNKTVIDFGTGTGILAILAEKMQAASVLALDCDDWSINNAKENIEMNGCRNISVIKADHFPEEENADIILANINLNIIKENLTPIKKALKPGGTALFSGIMLQDREQIKAGIENAGLHIKHLTEKDGWLALYAIK